MVVKLNQPCILKWPCVYTGQVFFFLRTNCDGELEENHEPLKLLQSCSCQCGRTPATIPTLSPDYLTTRTHIAQPIPPWFLL